MLIIKHHQDILGMSTLYMNTYGKRQRILRQDLELTQNDLSDLIARQGVKIGQGYISEIERTDKTPTGDIIAATAKVLNTSADFLLMLTDDPAPIKELNHKDVFISEEAGEVAKIVDELDEDSREVVLRSIRFLRSRDAERRDLHQEVAALLVAGINQFDDNLRKAAQSVLSRIVRPRHSDDGTDTHHRAP